MGRQHVIVGGDNPKVPNCSFGKAALIGTRSGESVGLTTAGQMRPGWAMGFSGGHPVQITATTGAASFDDTGGDTGEHRVQGHCAFFSH
jgi:hypothetical protein